jgi:Gp49-like protein DUF891
MKATISEIVPERLNVSYVAFSFDPPAGSNWRVVYRIDADAIVILEVFAKKTESMPKAVIATCRKRLKEYDSAGK